MIQYRRIFFRAAVVCLALQLSLVSCSEERKREAARIAAELEAKERGESLPPEPIELDSTIQAADDTSGANPEPVLQAGQSTDGALHSVSDSANPGVESAQKEPSNRLAVPVSTPASMPPVITDGWTVQVESSPLKSYVESQVQVFRDRGYDAYLGSVTKEDKTYYRLRVGKFIDRVEAVRVSTEINSMYNLQSWVDRASW